MLIGDVNGDKTVNNTDAGLTKGPGRNGGDRSKLPRRRPDQRYNHLCRCQGSERREGTHFALDTDTSRLVTPLPGLYSRIPRLNSQTRTAARIKRFVRVSVPTAARRGSGCRITAAVGEGRDFGPFRRLTERREAPFASPRVFLVVVTSELWHPIVTRRCNPGNNLVKSTEGRKPFFSK